MGVVRWLKSFFGFSRGEIIGMRILFAGLLITLLFPVVAKRWTGKEPAIDPETRGEIELFLTALRNQREKKPVVVYREFDPNELDRQGWLELGFTERQTEIIHNYVNKGGRFRRKEDLQKIFSVSEDDYKRIADYIVIPASKEYQEHPKTKRHNNTDQNRERYNRSRFANLTVEVNNADSFTFQFLPGIGPAFASRIVRFRERLGGFHELNQLMDVYGMDSARYQGFVGQLTLDTALIRRIPINHADYEELRRHPLIGNKLAGVIVRFRKHHGTFGSIDDLKKIQVVDEYFLRNIVPYLEF